MTDAQYQALAINFDYLASDMAWADVDDEGLLWQAIAMNAEATAEYIRECLPK